MDLAGSLPTGAYRRLIAWPLALAAGGLTALFVLQRWPGSVLLALACGIVVVWLATRVRDSLEARLAAAFTGDPASVLLSLALDIAIGAAIGEFAGQLLDTSLLGTVGAAAGLAGLWSFLVGQVFGGAGLGRALDFLLEGSQSADYAREPILADGEALEREGHVESAIRKYREVAERRPREAEAYLRAARLLAGEGRAREATDLLRLARRRARLTSGADVLIGRQLADLAAGPLGDPAAALAELTLLANRYRRSAAGQEAARAAAQLRATLPA